MSVQSVLHVLSLAALVASFAALIFSFRFVHEAKRAKRKIIENRQKELVELQRICKTLREKGESIPQVITELKLDLEESLA